MVTRIPLWPKIYTRKKLVKNIVITGATGDIAKEIVSLLSKTNDHLILVSRSRTALEKLYGQLANVTLLTNDELLTAEQSYDVDILINNAGVLDKGLNAIDQIDYDDLNRVIDINQKGTMYCMSEALKVMKSGASIVNISSVAGQYGAGGAVYVSTKAAIIGVTKHAAMRFAKEKIRCNVICPGSITTDMAAGLTPDTMDMKMRGAMSAHSDLTLQPCSPLDVAKVALFLASDDAAPLTGQVVVSDYGVDL